MFRIVKFFSITPPRVSLILLDLFYDNKHVFHLSA
jgi:hypothetical protein